MTSIAFKTVGVLPALTGLLASWGAVELWERWLRYRQRRQELDRLLEMSDRELHDIGISRVDAIREASRPAWQPDDTN
jgi:uncharacterized protein YjiS (DUF1127 family)